MICDDEDKFTIERFKNSDRSSCESACMSEPDCVGFTITFEGSHYILGTWINTIEIIPNLRQY